MTEISRFAGSLQVEEDPGDRIRAEMVLHPGRVDIAIGGQRLGSWPLNQVTASRLEGDRFELRLGSETAVFTADDALSFSYEALPRMNKRTMLGGLGKLFTVKREPDEREPNAMSVDHERTLHSDSAEEPAPATEATPAAEMDAIWVPTRRLVEVLGPIPAESHLQPEDGGRDLAESVSDSLIALATLPASEPPAAEDTEPQPDLSPSDPNSGPTATVSVELPPPALRATSPNASLGEDMTPGFADPRQRLYASLQRLTDAVAAGHFPPEQAPIVTNLLQSISGLLEATGDAQPAE